MGENSYMKKTIIFTNGSNSYLRASGLFQDGGTHGFSAPGSAIFYVEIAYFDFAKVKRVKIVFNEDRTRDVYCKS